MFVTFIDDYSNYVTGFILAQKSQVKDAFFIFAERTETQFGYRIQKLRVDDGTEYKATIFLDFCRLKGTVIETSEGYTPELNGKAESFNRTIIEMMRVNFNTAKLPGELWDE